MRPLITLFLTLVVAGGAIGGAPQAGALADWPTDGGDATRTGWQQHESILSPSTLSGLRLLWTRHVDNEPRQMHALLPPLVIGRTMAGGRERELVVLARVSDNLFGIDAATGELVWSRHFDSTFKPRFGDRGYGALCPGGQTAAPVIAPASAPGRHVVYAVSWDGRLRTVDASTGAESARAEPFFHPM